MLPSREPQAPLPGRYQIGAQIASGGMGVIHRALDTLAQREVAYKRLAIREESARARITMLFEREYNALARIAHPNVVKVYEYGLDEQGPYYTMELLTGQDLSTLAPIPMRAACQLLADVASALSLLHARRLLHRDVSAANVRATRKGRAKLLDFGALTRFGKQSEVVGTAPFVAPECLSGSPLDQRTDLFSLGALAYWTLTGRHAFETHGVAKLPDVWETAPPPPSSFSPNVPPELDELVLSLLELDPAARPPTAAHFLEHLSAVAPLTLEAEDREVAYSYLTHPPLFGRDAVLGDLQAQIEAAVKGEGSAALVEASVGAGRTAVLEQAAVDAQLLGATTLHFQAGRGATLSQALVRLSRGLGLSAPVTFDPANEEAPRTSLDATERQGRMVAAAQACALALCEQMPLAIFADDIHAADAESLALLASLTHQTSDRSLALVMSARSDCPSVDPNALAKLAQGARKHALSALLESDTEDLVHAIFGPAPNAHRLAAWLQAQSGGNPGQCMDLSRLLLSRGDITYSLGKFALPHHVAQPPTTAHQALQLSRLSVLSDSASRVVQLLSLHDAALPRAAAARAANLSADPFQAAVEQLLAHSLIRLEDGSLYLLSASMKTAVASSLQNEEEREALHGALAVALLEAGSGLADETFAACDHLIEAGREEEATQVIDRMLHARAFDFEMGRVPLFEKVLSIYRRQGRTEEQCIPLFITLLQAAFFGDLATLYRHFDSGFRALSNVTGMTLAARLSPYLGGKLALYVGLLCAAIRHRLTPRARRFGTFKDNVRALISSAGATAAAAISALDPRTAMRAVSFLEPFGAMSSRGGPYLAREFCIATAELGAGHFGSSSRRYRWLLERLAQPVLGLDEASRQRMYDGCLHGKAHCEVTRGSAEALELADQLQARDAFFAPHAEVIRMTYYGALGLQELADAHRVRGEVLALRGGASWSAFTMMAVRSAYCYMITRDTLGLVRAGEELHRLSAIAPNLRAVRDAARAYHESLHDHHAYAVECYERIFSTYDVSTLPGYRVDRALYAEALRGAGRCSEAKEVCLDLLRAGVNEEHDSLVVIAAMEQLALTEAALGNLDRALDLLREVEPHVGQSGSLLVVGALHRSRAQIALLAGDAKAFDEHFARMAAIYRPTQNAALIQQCRKLLMQAEASGLDVTTRWESLVPSTLLEALSEARIELTPEQTNVILTQPFLGAVSE